MKANKLFSAALFSAALFTGVFAQAQSTDKPFFTEFKLEARADAQLWMQNDDHTLSLDGRYFNLHLGGNLTDKLSYYVRQRIKADDGSIRFFDNTDFLYINYQANEHWGFRLGKDALAVGGVEYDLRPIDVPFASYDWENIYCFQLAAAAYWQTVDNRQRLELQFGTSPFAFTGSPYGEKNLFSYNLLWMGNLGSHVSTLWSANLFQYGESEYMGNIALGTKAVFPKVEGYLDFIYRTPHMDFSENDLSLIARLDYKFDNGITLFAKAGFENNDDEDPLMANTGLYRDILSMPQSRYEFAGLGVWYRPQSYKELRLHAFVAGFDRTYTDNNIDEEQSVLVNLGVTWDINFLKYINRAK